jgi:hypothetical protein
MRQSICNKAITFYLVFFFLTPFFLRSQHFFSMKPATGKQVEVTDESRKIYPHPWAGGMNSCQFGAIDLNMNGIKDLFVFDRHGNRIMTFLNGGTPGQIDYTYTPEYAEAFPEMFDWVILKDYNNNGLTDIFTYSKEYPGIIVYKNVSDTELKFELMAYPYLTSLQGGGEVNILVTDVDYPGIADIDGDGDLDILVFGVFGSFIQYHRNMSMELYGVPDSLKFEEVTRCWGWFAESEESNVIYLDTCQPFKNENRVISDMWINDRAGRHVGSTFLLLDLNANGLMDLVLGDVDYPNLIELINGGTPDSAYMISQDPLFPSYDKPVQMFSMPVGAYIDVNNNGINDLILSPFDPSLITSENHRSVWLYLNSGQNDQPNLNFVQKDFLQEGMIDVGSGAYPVFADYDGDGLPDLFISNFGYYMYSWYGPGMFLHSVYWSNIALFRNTGTATQPQFSRVTHDFAGLHSLHLTGIYPTFGDLDGDGDPDMIIGHEEGSLIFFENIAGPGQPMVFADPVFNYQDIQVGKFSTPQLFDLDGDGLIDLIIGEQKGNLNYYRNTGTAASPQFQFITDSLGKVNVTNYNLSYNGYSTPCFFRNMENETRLIVGSEHGKIFYFKDIDGNLEGTFTECDSLFVILNGEPGNPGKGIRTAAAIADLDQDGFFELIVGNYAGGVNYYPGIQQPQVASVNPVSQGSTQFKLYPNPAAGRLMIEMNGSLGMEVIRISVFDLFGNQLMTHTVTGKQTIELNISGLASGVYLCKVERIDNRSNPEIQRFVKIF